MREMHGMIQVMSNSALLIRMDCLPRIVSQWVTIIYEGSCSFIYKRLWKDIHEEYIKDDKKNKGVHKH